MTDPVATAIARARAGLDWSHPCLLWVADYVRDVTGTDYAADWRAEGWTEWSARRAMLQLAAGGVGTCQVERVLDAFARRHGWHEAEVAMQGAVMVGAYRGLAADGSPTIFDRVDRWILGHVGQGRVTVTATMPDRAWEIPLA